MNFYLILFQTRNQYKGKWHNDCRIIEAKDEEEAKKKAMEWAHEAHQAEPVCFDSFVFLAKVTCCIDSCVNRCYEEGDIARIIQIIHSLVSPEATLAELFRAG